MKSIELEWNGQRLRGATAQSGSTVWYCVGGVVWAVESQSRSRRGHAGATIADPTEIRAPMPGKIIKVAVTKGGSVNVGDVLIVMEAMKMEYTLKSQLNGVVRDLQCHEGQQVALGATLVKLEIA